MVEGADVVLGDGDLQDDVLEDLVEA
ncbi:MAG: hypothetical protein JWN17_183, partial [Frankiales bacterium]|nr:hypothetical protein [Frankiales bacterium]